MKRLPESRLSRLVEYIDPSEDGYLFDLILELVHSIHETAKKIPTTEPFVLFPFREGSRLGSHLFSPPPSTLSSDDLASTDTWTPDPSARALRGVEEMRHCFARLLGWLRVLPKEVLEIVRDPERLLDHDVLVQIGGGRGRVGFGGEEGLEGCDEGFDPDTVDMAAFSDSGGVGDLDDVVSASTGRGSLETSLSPPVIDGAGTFLVEGDAGGATTGCHHGLFIRPPFPKPVVAGTRSPGRVPLKLCLNVCLYHVAVCVAMVPEIRDPGFLESLDPGVGREDGETRCDSPPPPPPLEPPRATAGRRRPHPDRRHIDRAVRSAVGIGRMARVLMMNEHHADPGDIHPLVGYCVSVANHVLIYAEVLVRESGVFGGWEEVGAWRRVNLELARRMVKVWGVVGSYGVFAVEEVAGRVAGRGRRERV
ncbi:hypothetical protein HDU67_009158 [Dinochytrium kinnereticum]|nr:hypothetical protein HDU67_009158 [Dinochytrium kinnereticum]